MGKTTKWFRSIFSSKKSSSSGSSPAASTPDEEKKPKWGLAKSNKKLVFSAKGSAHYRNGSNNDQESLSTPYVEGLDANKHAIAVAAATAAVAEAALAAAHAAAEVVRLTSGNAGGSRSGNSGSDRRRELAATRIQSAFRAYLARRALRALKGLVKLQALVRGRIVRKQSADMLRRMQAMARIQARASATRTHSSESSHSSLKSSQSRHPHMQKSGPKWNIINQNGGERTYLPANWLDRWMEECTWNDQREASFKHRRCDDEKNDKILEIDTWRPSQNPRRGEKTFSSQYFSAWNDSMRGCSTFDSASRHSTSRNSTKYQNPDPSLSSGEVSSLRSVKFPPEADQVAPWNVESSPHVHSASSRPGSSHRRGAFSPARSECTRSFYGDYISYPNYMSNTESSRAKVRSQSAPRQRLQFERLASNRTFVPGLCDAETCSEKDLTFQFNGRTKGFSGAGRLNKQRTPVHAHTGSFGSSYDGRP